MLQHSQAMTEGPASSAPAGARPMAHFGNQANLRRLQAKLMIGTIDDPLEQEADAAADQVMRMTDPRISHAAPPTLSRKCAECEEEAKKVPLQRKTSKGGMGAETAPSVVGAVLNSPGRPLDRATHEFMANRFGTDFSDVRIHTEAQAAQSAAAVDARAYTVGRSVVFGAGQYDPAGDAGRRLLAHELAHVIQQHNGSSTMSRSASAVSRDHPLANIIQQPQRSGGLLQRAPAPGQLRPPEPLEVVAQRIARLAIGPASTQVNLKGGPDKVVSVVRNKRTGRIYVGLNIGEPAKRAKVIADAIEAQKARIAAGEVTVVHTAENAVGGHAEVNALNAAIREEEAALGTMNEAALASTFEIHNVWLSGKHKLETAPRCEHCARITRGVAVTESLFKAEGGVSGEIKVPQRGEATKTGGARVTGDTLHGEISAAKPSGEPPRATRTSPSQTVRDVNLPSGSSASKTAEAAKTTATVGEPIRPVNEATPGFDPHGSGVGGAIQMIQAAQFAGLQRDEVEKFNDRLAQLQPKIDAFLARGFSVELILIVEKPDRPDVLCPTVFCDQGQLIYFRELFISRVWDRPRSPAAVSTTHQTMGPTGGRNSQIPYVHEGGSLTDEKEIRFLSAKHKDYHCEYRKETSDPPRLPAVPTSAEPDLTTPEHIKDIAATYTGELFKMFTGSTYDVFALSSLGVDRSLKVELTASGRATPKMSLDGQVYSFLDGGPQPPRYAITGRFTMGEGVPPAATWYRSSMEYHPEKGLILEWAKGLDAALNTTWDALFRWRRQ